VCIDDLNAKLLHPYVNPNLKYISALGTQEGRRHGQCRLVRHDGLLCLRIRSPRTALLWPIQDAFDGRMAFSDFVLFVYEP